MSAPSQPMLPSHSDPVVAEIIAQLKQQLEAQAQRLEAHQKQQQADARELAYARLKIELLEERLRLQRIAKYGKRSETLSDLQLELLDLEPGVSSDEIAAESEREPITAQPEDQQQDKPEDKPQDKERRKHPGRQALPAHMKRVEQIVACTAEQCTCGQCGKETKVIGYEETEVLDVKPAEYFVTVIKREKRACKSCEEQGVRTAIVPERIAPKSLLSDRLIVDIVVAKYCESMPLFRQQGAIMRDAGVSIALSTIDDAVMRVGELLMPIAAAMKRELLAGSYIQADETPVGVQMHDKRGKPGSPATGLRRWDGKNHQAYMWQYGSPGRGVVFDFRMGRDGDGPKQFLGQFNGLLQTDGYAGYNNVGGAKMVHACCLAHARRKFVDAVKVDPKDRDSARVVVIIDELFAIDRQAREKKLDHATRHALRMEKAPRLLELLRVEALALQKKALPKSLAGQAANYTLSLWQKLTLFLNYPELELSTNIAENSMRPIAIGRRNWLHLGSKEAGPKIAVIFSIVESCRRLGIPIRNYLADTLPGLADRSIKTLAELTPEAFAAKRAS